MNVALLAPKIIFFLLVTLSVPAIAFDLGLGVSLVSPNGFTVKSFANHKRLKAYDGAIGWGDEELYLHGDYLMIQPTFYREGSILFDLYYGIGGRFIYRDEDNRSIADNDDEIRLGFRLPIGVSALFTSVDIEGFGEMSVTADLYPESSVDLHVTLGGRYYP